MRRRNWRAAVGAASATCAWTGSASAHAPTEGLSTFYAYFLHPVSVPAHALLIIATALLLGRSGGSAVQWGLAGMSLGLCAGVGLVAGGAAVATDQRLLLALALATGAAVAVDFTLAMVGALVLAAIVGAVVLLDSEVASPTTRQGFLAGAGIVCGVLYTTIVVAGLTVGLTQRWQRIGMRIVGSWIAAIALLVLSVAVKG